jgi:hypothetical protein
MRWGKAPKPWSLPAEFSREAHGISDQVGGDIRSDEINSFQTFDPNLGGKKIEGLFNAIPDVKRPAFKFHPS